MDRILTILVRIMAWMSGVAPLLGRLGIVRFNRWKMGNKLSILLVGYNGRRNTGADARVREIVLMLNRILGEENIDIGVMTLNAAKSAEYFDQPNVTLIPFPSTFIWQTFTACSQYHMAMLCEGSTLTSKFSNALTLFFCLAAGIMKRQKKPCIAFGSEAGKMDDYVKRCAAALCSDTYFIARTEQSLAIIENLGFQGVLGTDTAWTFTHDRQQWIHERLAKTGWDGKSPLLGVAVINPFCWPISPSAKRLFKGIFTGNWEGHFESLYFHAIGKERKERFESYLDAYATTTKAFCQKTGAWPVIIGMDGFDREVCQRLQEKLPASTPIFSSEEYSAFELTALLENLSLLITSRYHARVLSLAAAVPTVAVSIDERLHNIYHQLGQFDDYYLDANDEQLAEKLPNVVDRIWDNRDKAAEQLTERYPLFPESMGEMGIALHTFIVHHFPGIVLPSKPGSWRDVIDYSPVSRRIR